MSPLFIIIVVVFIVDPYYLFTDQDKYDEAKFQIGYSFDQGRRYKIFTYCNKPTDKIILGASEINIINEHNIPEDGWHSLSYGGAPLQESLQMYWEVQKINPIKKVLIAPEFIKYYNAISTSNGDSYYANYSWDSSQSARTFEIYDNKFDYFIDKYTLKSTWQFIIHLFGKNSNRSKPQVDKFSFWKSQLDYAHKQYENNVVIPEKIDEIKGLFSSIKENSEKKGIEIMIVIPIQHIDLLRVEFQDGVFDIYKDYISFLAETFDGIYYLSYQDLISDKDNLFSDPFHCLDNECYLNALFGDSKINPLTADTTDVFLNNVRLKLFYNE